MKALHLTKESVGHLLLRLAGIGFGDGALAGLFGLGGSFLIVPGLMVATGVPLTGGPTTGNHQKTGARIASSWNAFEPTGDYNRGAFFYEPGAASKAGKLRFLAQWSETTLAGTQWRWVMHTNVVAVDP